MIKIQDGDLYKILPILNKDKKIIPCISVDCIWLPQSHITLYETDGKILPKIYRKNPKLQGKKHFFSVLHEGQVDWISVGRTLHQKILFTPEALALKDDYHLQIHIDHVNAGSFSLPSYDKSQFIKHDWKAPFNHHHPDIWTDWLIQSQSQMWNFLEQFNVKYHIDKMKKELDVDLSEIISEFRDKKLDLILD